MLEEKSPMPTIRVRACGLMSGPSGLLMVNHGGLYGHDFWAPPGGGVEYGTTSAQTLLREFEEECGLQVDVRAYRFTCHVVLPHVHAIELFHIVELKGGSLVVGRDPEYGDRQIITDVRFMGFQELYNLPFHHLHPVFRKLKHPREILEIKGFLEVT